MKWTHALTICAIMNCLFVQFALPDRIECPSNCVCHNTDVAGIQVALHCQGLPETFLQNVHSLTLSHVNTTKLDISILDKNYADALQHLNLSNLGISNIWSSDKDFILYKLNTLVLSNNNILNLSAETFKWCQDIVELAVNDNGAKHISKDAFIHLQNLKHLNLGNNNLLNLDNIDLPQSLVNLDLCNNQFEQIPVLNNLHNLETLSLGGNEYKLVATGVFEGLPKLSNLSLGDAVTSVQTGSLSVLDNLTSLKLTGKGDLNSIAGKEIQTLPGLQALELSFFIFPKITKAVMGGFHSLQVLRLVDINSTSGFEDGVFESLTSLSLLDLSRSQALLASLLLGIQKGLNISSLEILVISETNISVLNTQLLALTPNLKKLDISNNPLMCDNKWQDLLHTSFVSELKFLNLQETMCAEPKSLFGKQLMDASVLHEITKDQAIDEYDNSTSSSTISPDSRGGIYYYLDLWGITYDDLLYTVLALGICVFILLIVIIIVACCRSRKSRCYCNSAKEGSAESFMMRANSEYTFDNFTLSETMAECQRGTLNRNGKQSTKS